MSIGFATLFSLCINVTLAIFGTALVLLILWQDLRRRSNQYLALCMAIFALYGALNAPLQVAQQANLEPEPLLNLLLTLYVVGLILMFNFVLSFAGYAASAALARARGERSVGCDLYGARLVGARSTRT